LREFIKQYAPYYKNYKRQFLFAIIGMLMVAGGTSGTAYVIKPVLDEIFINKDKEMLQLLPLAVIFLYALKGFGKYIQTYYVGYIGSDIIRIVRDKFLSHILTQNLKFFNQKHGGELVSRVTNDINSIQSGVSSHIANIFLESMTIFALMGVVIYQSPKLAFYGLVVIPLVIYPLSKLAKKMKKLSHKTQEKISSITSILNEIFNNIELIIANNSQKSRTVEFKNTNKEYFHLNMKALKTNALVSPIMEILGSIAAALVIMLGGMEVINGDLSVGEFFSFMTALFMLYTPIKKISSVYNSFQKSIAANERIGTIFETSSDILGGDVILNKQISTMVFNDISLKYDDNIALKSINIEVKKGEKIALVGDSGGGKSSLVNLLLRFYDPFKGEIKFDDTNINNFTLESLRNNISIVTQRVYIFNDTIANNIALGADMDEERIKFVLNQAHALDFVENFHDGINTQLDEFGTNLSGGQRQRIAIARALYKNPQILIFDEATSALDNESESIITKVLDEVSQNRITFVIAHRLSTVQNSNKILVFKNGEIVGNGSEEELLNNCPEYKKLKMLSVQ